MVQPSQQTDDILEGSLDYSHIVSQKQRKEGGKEEDQKEGESTHFHHTTRSRINSHKKIMGGVEHLQNIVQKGKKMSKMLKMKSVL